MLGRAVGAFEARLFVFCKHKHFTFTMPTYLAVQHISRVAGRRPRRATCVLLCPTARPQNARNRVERSCPGAWGRGDTGCVVYPVPGRPASVYSPTCSDSSLPGLSMWGGALRPIKVRRAGFERMSGGPLSCDLNSRALNLIQFSPTKQTSCNTK